MAGAHALYASGREAVLGFVVMSDLLRSLAVCDVGNNRKDIPDPTYDIGWDHRYLCIQLPQLEDMREVFRDSTPFEGPERDEFEAHKDLGVQSLRRVLQCSRNMSDACVGLYRSNQQLELASRHHDLCAGQS